MKEMEAIKEEDRLRRLQILEKKIRDPRNVSNVDSLLVRIPIHSIILYRKMDLIYHLNFFIGTIL